MWSLWVALSACNGAPGFRGPDLPSVALPRSEVAVAVGSPSVELLLSPRGLFLDPRPWYDAVPSEVLRPVGPGLLLELTDWKLALPPAHELALPLVSGVLQVVAGEGVAPPLLLRAPPDAPFEMARRVIYSAQMAGYPAIDVAIVGEGGEVLRVPLSFPPPCGSDVPRSGVCLFPVIVETDGGWEVWAEASEAVSASCAPGVRGVSGEAWWRKQLVTVAGTCPAASDLPGLSRFLSGLTQRQPTCGGWVAPRADASWQEALDALSAVRGAGGFAAAGFGAARRPESTSCEVAFVVSSSPADAGSGSSETPPAPPSR